MIKLDKIIGNISTDHTLKSMHEEMIKLGKIETVTFERMESERTRIRKVSNKGTDLVLILSEGSRFRDGDVSIPHAGENDTDSDSTRIQ